MRTLMALAIVASAAGAADAMVFAEQDFNSLGGSTFVSDGFPIGTVDAPLTNSGSSNSGGPGLDFQSLYTDTRGNLGPRATDIGGDSSDFIGVNSFTGSNAPGVAADGTAVSGGVEQNFQFNDTDGLVELVFETVDTTGFTNVVLSLDYWVANTGFESDDSFTITLTDGSVSETLLSLGETGLEDANTIGDTGSASEWNSLSVPVPVTLTGSSLTLTIGVDTSAGSENVFVDNIAFSGDASSTPVVPEPGTALVFAGLAAAAVLGGRRNEG